MERLKLLLFSRLEGQPWHPIMKIVDGVLRSGDANSFPSNSDVLGKRRVALSRIPKLARVRHGCAVIHPPSTSIECTQLPPYEASTSAVAVWVKSDQMQLVRNYLQITILRLLAIVSV